MMKVFMFYTFMTIFLIESAISNQKAYRRFKAHFEDFGQVPSGLSQSISAPKGDEIKQFVAEFVFLSQNC